MLWLNTTHCPWVLFSSVGLNLYKDRALEKSENISLMLITTIILPTELECQVREGPKLK